MTTLAPVELIRNDPIEAMRSARAEQAFTWTVWPAKECPMRTVVLLVAMTALGVFSGVAFQDAWLGAVAAVALAVSVQRYLLPTDYVLTRDGITVHEPLRVRRVLWSDVQGVIWRNEQGLLKVSRDALGRSTPHHGGFSGIVIMLGRDAVASEARREAVDAFLRRNGGYVGHVSHVSHAGHQVHG